MPACHQFKLAQHPLNLAGHVLEVLAISFVDRIWGVLVLVAITVLEPHLHDCQQRPCLEVRGLFDFL